MRSELSPLIMLFISLTSGPPPGEFKDHRKFSARPPPPKDWKPERVRFPQDESVSGP